MVQSVEGKNVKHLTKNPTLNSSDQLYYSTEKNYSILEFSLFLVHMMFFQAFFERHSTHSQDEYERRTGKKVEQMTEGRLAFFNGTHQQLSSVEMSAFCS